MCRLFCFVKSLPGRIRHLWRNPSHHLSLLLLYEPHSLKSTLPLTHSARAWLQQLPNLCLTSARITSQRTSLGIRLTNRMVNLTTLYPVWILRRAAPPTAFSRIPSWLNQSVSTFSFIFCAVWVLGLSVWRVWGQTSLKLLWSEQVNTFLNESCWRGTVCRFTLHSTEWSFLTHGELLPGWSL